MILLAKSVISAEAVAAARSCLQSARRALSTPWASNGSASPTPEPILRSSRKFPVSLRTS